MRIYPIAQIDSEPTLRSKSLINSNSEAEIATTRPEMAQPFSPQGWPLVSLVANAGTMLQAHRMTEFAPDSCTSPLQPLLPLPLCLPAQGDPKFSSSCILRRKTSVGDSSS